MHIQVISEAPADHNRVAEYESEMMKVRLKQFCKTAAPQKEDGYYKNLLLVSQEHKLGYCGIAKVGTLYMGEYTVRIKKDVPLQYRTWRSLS